MSSQHTTQGQVLLNPYISGREGGSSMYDSACCSCMRSPVSDPSTAVKIPVHSQGQEEGHVTGACWPPVQLQAKRETLLQGDKVESGGTGIRSPPAFAHAQGRAHPSPTHKCTERRHTLHFLPRQQVRVFSIPLVTSGRGVSCRWWERFPFQPVPCACTKITCCVLSGGSTALAPAGCY